MNKLHMRIQDVLSFPQYWVDWIIYNGYEYINVRETSTGYELIAGINSITIPINTQVVIDLTDVGRAEYQLQQTEHKLDITVATLEAISNLRIDDMDGARALADIALADIALAEVWTWTK